MESWYKQNAAQKTAEAKVKDETKPVSDSPKPKSSVRKTKKLSYKDQRELDSLPAEIETLETALAELQEQVNDPEFFKQTADSTAATLATLSETEETLSRKYARWDELESMLEDTQQ